MNQLKSKPIVCLSKSKRMRIQFGDTQKKGEDYIRSQYEGKKYT